jgi:hypothetical protein
MSSDESGVKRGILYIVWGTKIEPLLQRSIQSVRKFYPDIPVEIVRGKEDPVRGLQQKSRMISHTPFESTLFLDADTVVVGNLDYGFERAEEFGLACCICECPWLRRYGQSEGDQIEYNTGVLFFTPKSKAVFETWQSIAPGFPSKSVWLAPDGTPRGLEYDDQAGFGRAVRSCNFNPHVLPLNYNFRPGFHRSFFAPLKVWHDPHEVPPALLQISNACELGQRPVSYLNLRFGDQKS